MRTKKSILFVSIIALSLSLVACNSNKSETDISETKDEMHMEHSESGEIPKGLKLSENPKYEIGSKALIETDNMEGMKGAEATIVGAYDTVAYVVSYDPTTGGEREENHKWVVQEEIKDADEDLLNNGSEVVLEADHMKGMEGAKAVVESHEKTTVYMIDYISTTDGKEVKNHKWVTEEELSDI